MATKTSNEVRSRSVPPFRGAFIFASATSRQALVASRRCRRLQTFACCLHDACCDAIGITICGWATIFHVSFTVLLCSTRNADGRATIGNTKLEILDAAGFMLACKAFVVAPC